MESGGPRKYSFAEETRRSGILLAAGRSWDGRQAAVGVITGLQR